MDRVSNRPQNGFPVDWAEIQITQTVALQNSLLEQHSSLYRWLLGARLAANGGAAVAVTGLTDLGLTAKLLSVSMFSAGVILSIITAELDQAAIQKGLAPNLRMLGFWVKFKNSGVYDEEAINKIITDSESVAKSNRGGKIVGWLSLAMFALGIAGASLSGVVAAQRTAVIQKAK